MITIQTIDNKIIEIKKGNFKQTLAYVKNELSGHSFSRKTKIWQTPYSLKQVENIAKKYLIVPVEKKVFDWSSFIPSFHQLKIERAFSNTIYNILVNATAGSGKTTLLLWLLSTVKTNNVIFLAFGNKPINELKEKITKGQASTLHSLGLEWLKRQQWCKTTNYKTSHYLRSQLQDEKKFKSLIAGVKEITSKYKNTYIDHEPTEEKIKALIEKYDIKLKSDYENEIIHWSINAIIDAWNNKKFVDFDDMLWMPPQMGFTASYDLIFVDECQDLNAPQLAMLKAIKGRFIFVGDSNQTIYEFRGAMTGILATIKDSFNCTLLGLPLSYRNSKAITRLINKELPHIHHECLPDAPEGIAEYTTIEFFMQNVKPNNLVIAPYNAHLIKPAFELLRQGKKVQILGHDIAETMQELITKNKGETYQETLENINDAIAELKTKLWKRADYWQDIGESITVLAESVQTEDELINTIESLYSTCQGQCIIFGTIHKVKGSEAQTCYILRHDKIQDDNIKFVAYSRGIENLYIIGV